ncbi:hypothetical protein PPERSA_07051 [Pseudocohnilembus persalinus]|uniref:Uncharacterized protein n=1 Tax=Pseudocohnilembus persalinus TaxID=266149 RepID=A0A0V0QAW3_PSEPJ|nr:hypothetical protein PPERSA_07051 [Pseudocohnilembus persalinus]|eukprot:KRW99279.1 hypothetical protein PPERSA_07051 [Pseudocohnilembus persalinus]
MHQIIYKILKFTIQNTNLEIVKSLLSEKNDIIKMIINNYRKDNLFTSIGRSNHCTRGYVSLIEKLSVLIYKQSFLLQLINHSSKDIDQDELIFYKSAKLPLVELDNPPEFQRQKLWIIDKREVKEQEDEQPKILYKLGHFNCWVEILDPESFHSIKEGKINPNFQFWDHYLNKNLEWQDYKQYKLELIIEEGNANLNKIKNIITTNQEELKLFQIDLSIKKQRNSQTYANSPNIQVLSGNQSSNIILPQEQNNSNMINNSQNLNNNKNYSNNTQAIRNTIQLKPIEFQSQVQIDKLSKQERIGRSKSIRIQKKFLSEPPTIDVFDKREIFLNMVVNGCFRLICFNKYCANNKNNKKNVSQLQAALLLRKLPQNELDNIYDCDTYEKIHQNKMDKDPDQQLNQKKQRLQKELRDLQKEYQKIDFLPNFMDQFQKIEEITKKVEQILKQCQNQPEFFEITVDIKKLQNKVSDTFQALPKKKIYLINQQKQNQANRERDINLCIHMGKIYEQNMNDIEKASQYYKQAQKEAIQANSIVHILKSRFLINNIREQHVINKLQQNSNLRIKKLKEQSQSQHVSFASDSYSQSNQCLENLV